jgi:hypothetical protein
VEVFGGVLVFRVVAAADVAAGHAQPEVDPVIAHREAFLAAFRCPRLHFMHVGEMSAHSAS